VENTGIVTRLETINFYVSRSEEIRDNLEVTDAKHFPLKTKHLVRSYKECVNRILLECKNLFESVDLEPFGNFSLTPDQSDAISKVKDLHTIYLEINRKI
jgi:hypothetical protein